MYFHKGGTDWEVWLFYFWAYVLRDILRAAMQTAAQLSVALYYSSQYQKTALHYVIEGGHHDTVRVLLDRGADPNTYNEVSGA